MSLTQIIGNVFKPRQKALEEHQNGGEALQRAVLQHLVQTAKDTEYGHNHAFAATKGYGDFVRNIPVNSYEELKESIKKDLPQLPYVFISAITGDGLTSLKDILWTALVSNTE